jgi:hypothetical protein
MFCNFAMEILQIEKAIVFLKHDKQLSSKGELLIPEATDSMIIYHSNSLHHRITNCRSYKNETSFLQVIAQFIRDFCLRRNVGPRFPVILFWLSVNEAPKIRIKTSKFFLHYLECLCIFYSGLNF